MWISLTVGTFMMKNFLEAIASRYSARPTKIGARGFCTVAPGTISTLSGLSIFEIQARLVPPSRIRHGSLRPTVPETVPKMAGRIIPKSPGQFIIIAANNRAPS